MRSGAPRLPLHDGRGPDRLRQPPRSDDDDRPDQTAGHRPEGEDRQPLDEPGKAGRVRGRLRAVLGEDGLHRNGPGALRHHRICPPWGAASDPDQARGRDKFAAFAEEIEARSVWPSVRTDAPPVPLSGDPIKGWARTDADGRGRTRTGATQGPTGARRSRVTPTIGEVTACWTSSQAIATWAGATPRFTCCPTAAAEQEALSGFPAFPSRPRRPSGSAPLERVARGTKAGRFNPSGALTSSVPAPHQDHPSKGTA